MEESLSYIKSMPLSEVRQQFRYFFLPVQEQNNILLVATVFRAFVSNATQNAQIRDKVTAAVTEQKENDGADALREQNSTLREELSQTQEVLGRKLKSLKCAESSFHAYERRCAELCSDLSIKSIRHAEAEQSRSMFARRWRTVRNKAARCVSKLPNWCSSIHRWRDEALCRWVFCALLREVKLRNSYEIKALRAVNAEQAEAAANLAAEIHELRDELAASQVLAEKRQYRIEELEIELKEAVDSWHLASEDALSQNLDARKAQSRCRSLVRRVWHCATWRIIADCRWRKRLRDMLKKNIHAMQQKFILSGLWAWRFVSTAEQLAVEKEARKLAEGKIAAAEFRMREARAAAKDAESRAAEAESLKLAAERDRNNALVRLEKSTQEINLPSSFICFRCAKPVTSQQRGNMKTPSNQPSIDEARRFVEEKKAFLKGGKSPRNEGLELDVDLHEIQEMENLSKISEASNGLHTIFAGGRPPVAWSLEEAMKEVFAAPVENTVLAKPQIQKSRRQHACAPRLAQQRSKSLASVRDPMRPLPER